VGPCSVQGGASHRLRLKSGEAPPPRRAEEETMLRLNRSELAHVATRLRHAPTWEEQVLWQELRSKKLGVRFRRQVPLCGFIVDLYASRVGLIVEVDGGCHADRQRGDARRDRVLAQRGYRVLRLPAALVRTALPEAVARVRAALVP
jgi:very-short-patch-repair endonuclease